MRRNGDVHELWKDLLQGNDSEFVSFWFAAAPFIWRLRKIGFLWLCLMVFEDLKIGFGIWRGKKRGRRRGGERGEKIALFLTYVCLEHKYVRF